MLYRNGFRLALEGVDRVTSPGLLSHVGVYADEPELERLRERAATANCTIVLDDERALIIDDRFGVRWELNTFAYADPPRLSTGARTGIGLRSTRRSAHRSSTFLSALDSAPRSFRVLLFSDAGSVPPSLLK
jgi:hypothetical protein